jgi:hypothetical protein
MKPFTYILDADLRPVPVPMVRWAHWMEEQGKQGYLADCCIESTVIRPDGSSINLKEQPDYQRSDTDVWISTVFLGTDHNWSRYGPPLLFETMVFGGQLDEVQLRTSTWSGAQAQHANVVEAVVASAQIAPKPLNLPQETSTTPNQREDQ